MKALGLVVVFWLALSAVTGYALALIWAIEAGHLFLAVPLGLGAVIVLSTFLWFVFQDVARW